MTKHFALLLLMSLPIFPSQLMAEGDPQTESTNESFARFGFENGKIVRIEFKNFPPLDIREEIEELDSLSENSPLAEIRERKIAILVNLNEKIERHLEDHIRGKAFLNTIGITGFLSSVVPGIIVGVFSQVYFGDTVGILAGVGTWLTISGLGMELSRQMSAQISTLNRDLETSCQSAISLLNSHYL